MLKKEALPIIYPFARSGFGRSIDELIAEMFELGVRWIQIRAEGLNDRHLYESVHRAGERIPAVVKLFVEGRVDIALACAADGLQLSADDLPPSVARSVALERPLTIGFSAHTFEEAIEAAEDQDVDYISVGPIFESTASPFGPTGTPILKKLRNRISKPLVAVGGIRAENIREVFDAGADSAAVGAALFESGTIEETYRNLLDLVGPR